jgi:hypothetical protein
MRLINTETLRLEEFFNKAISAYAILSYTWGENELVFADYEQRTHQNLENIPDPAASKVRHFCQQAAKDGHKYAWINTAGIDKKSSAELSEAINSMYKSYQRSQMCYIYLGDVEKQPLRMNRRAYAPGAHLRETLIGCSLSEGPCARSHMRTTPPSLLQHSSFAPCIRACSRLFSHWPRPYPST